MKCCLYLALHHCNTGVGGSQVDTDDVGTSGCMTGRAGTANVEPKDQVQAGHSLAKPACHMQLHT